MKERKAENVRWAKVVKRKAAWAGKHGLKESRRAGSLEAMLDCRVGRGGELKFQKSWCDHTSLWNYYGKPVVFVSQPYSLNADEMFDIVAFVKTHNLDVIISGGGWHTEDILQVEIWKKGMYSQTYDAAKQNRDLISKITHE